MFYEHDGGYIPLKIVLIDVVGYYKDYEDNGKYDVKYNAKKNNFKLDDNSSDKIYILMIMVILFIILKYY